MTQVSCDGWCKMCGKGLIITPDGKQTVCCDSNCAAIDDDQPLVNEITYEIDCITGHNHKVGIPCDLEAEGYLGNPRESRLWRSSRDATIKKSEDRMRGLAMRAKCDMGVYKDGFNIYKLVYDGRLTSTRPTATVLSACLYIACRRARTSHMLMDFVPGADTTYSELGRAVRFIVTRTNVRIPLLDPTMQIERFCSELVKDNQMLQAVQRLAVRVVNRMKKDWLDAGRKPAGVTAAAVIIACRVYNYELDKKEVARKCQVSDSTIRKRLLEFARSESAGLNAEAFATSDLPAATFHPSFYGISNSAVDKTPLTEAEELEYFDTLKNLANIILAAKEDGPVKSEEIEDLEFAMSTLVVTKAAIDKACGPRAEKTLFLGTPAPKVKVTDEIFRNGNGIVNERLWDSVLTNQAEQRVRRDNFALKHGKRVEEQETRAAQKKAAEAEKATSDRLGKGYHGQNCPRRGWFPRKAGTDPSTEDEEDQRKLRASSEHIDYSRFHTYMENNE